MKRGNCYVTCEALYHLLGGKKRGLKPFTIRHEGDVHWFLVLYCNPIWYKDKIVGSTCGWEIIDPTAKQFKTPVPYRKATGRGFLTKKPSKRARQLMKTLLYQEVV